MAVNGKDQRVIKNTLSYMKNSQEFIIPLINKYKDNIFLYCSSNVKSAENK